MPRATRDTLRLSGETSTSRHDAASTLQRTRYSRAWGTSLVERFTSYMTIIRGTLVAIFAKPDDEGGMAVSIRCVNTAEELAEYDAKLAQDAQRQTEAEATQAHVVRMCLAELGVVLRHCDAARLDAAPMLTRDSTIAMAKRAFVRAARASGCGRHTQARAAAAARRRRPRLRCCCCRCRDGIELSNAKDRTAVAARPRVSRRARELAVSLLAGCCRPLGPAAAEGTGPPQAPWASAGHSTPTVSTVCVSMVCVSTVCVSTPSRNLASPEIVQYCCTIQGLFVKCELAKVWRACGSQLLVSRSDSAQCAFDHSKVTPRPPSTS